MNSEPEDYLDVDSSIINYNCDGIVYFTDAPNERNPPGQPKYHFRRVPIASITVHSDFFSKLFANAARDPFTGLKGITLHITRKQGRQLIRYVRKDRLKYPHLYAELLLPVAHHYRVTKLKTVCAEYLISQVDRSNVQHYRQLAASFEVPSLRDKCIEYEATQSSV